MDNSGIKVRELINEANDPPKPFTERNLRLDLPVIDVGADWNTRLEVEGIPGRGYYGTQEIFYKRIPLETVQRATPLRSDEVLTSQKILDMFNSAMNLFLTLEDLEPFEAPALEEGQNIEITLTSLPTSLGFTGTATFFVEYGKAWLDTVIAIKSLSVLNHPIKVTNKRSARMLTWNQDFTSLRDSLKLKDDGRFAEFAQLQAACAELGIPTWSNGPAVDVPTSAVEDANQSFHRVIVQPKVSSVGMEGDAYLHYNILEEM